MITPVCEMLGIEIPIFAFSHCRDVVAAVSKAGGLGVLGAVGFTPEQLEIELTWIDEHVDGKPYGVDTVIPAKYVGRQDGDLDVGRLQSMVSEQHKNFIKNLLKRNDIPELPDEIDPVTGMVGWSMSGGRAAVEVALRHPIALLVNALGPPPPDVIELAHKHGVKVAALVGRADQAVKQKNVGVDIIVAAGTEAGGHTGEISTMVLTPQVVDAVGDTPVLAAGGIGTGRQMAAAMALGAQGVWTGSIWLTVEEADEFAVVTDKLLAARSDHTVRSRCLTGKPVRQLKTDYTEAWEAEDSPGTLPMPLQMIATGVAQQRIYRHAESDSPTAGALMTCPVGQIVGTMNKVRPVKEVFSDMLGEYIDASERISGILKKIEDMG
ncbi:MAG: NAD(P)H-dependent flavin oxidoreductase YrpB (nitropropane dioxygenase family) [Bradymonadia bacterium]|jgi:NAD(P)H-dependent flavin oxidoreductase YrpB (nitropropane dioxygenase family)